MTVTAYYVYLLFRNKLAYRRGMKGKLVPVTDIVTFSYAEANKAGIADSVFLKALNVLFSNGLISKQRHGQFGGRRPTLYRVY